MKKLLLIITMLVLGIGSSNGQDYSIYEYVLANANSSTTTYYVSYFSSGDHDYGATSNIDNASEFKFEQTGTEGEYYWKDITNNKYIYALSTGWLAAADSKQDNDAYKWYIIAGENGLTITDKVNYNNGSPTKGLIGISSGSSSPGGYLATACTLSGNTSSRYWNLLLKPNKANNLSTGWYQIKYQDLGSASGDNIVSNVIQKYVMNHDNEVTVGDNKYSLYLGDKTFSDKDELAKSFVYFSQASKHDSYGSTGTLRGANGHFVAYTGIASTTPSDVCPIWVTKTDPTHITITSGYSSSTTRQTLVPKEDNGTKYLGAVTNKYPGTYWSPITLADYDMVAWTVKFVTQTDITVEYTGSSNYGIDKVYDGGTFFFDTDIVPDASDFTCNPGTGENTPYYNPGILIDTEEKTITVLPYPNRDIDVPSGYNGYIGGNTDISETEWKTKEYWCLSQAWSENNGPGTVNSNMYYPIYLKDVNASGMNLEGWNLQLKLENSTLTATTKKMQTGISNGAVNYVDENSTLDLTFAESGNNEEGTYTFNIDGTLTMRPQITSYQGDKASATTINLGTHGKFYFTAVNNNNVSTSNAKSFTINVTPTEPAKYNEVEPQTAPFAVIQNVTFADGKLTFGTTNAKWERVYAYDDLSSQTDAGEHFYYFIEEAEFATGEKKYKLYTYKQKIYSRNVTSGNFGSICIPNAVEEMDGIEKVLAVTEVGTDRVVMDEVAVDDMVAGVPYIFKSNASTINLTLKGNTVATPNNSTQTYLVGNFETPVYVPNSDEQNSYYVLQSNQFKKVTSANSIKSGSNRCYLKVPVTSDSRQSTLGIAVDEGGATGIDAMNSLINNNAEIYDLNGRKLKDLRKGINIVNGVKVIVK